MKTFFPNLKEKYFACLMGLIVGLIIDQLVRVIFHLSGTEGVGIEVVAFVIMAFVDSLIIIGFERFFYKEGRLSFTAIFKLILLRYITIDLLFELIQYRPDSFLSFLLSQYLCLVLFLGVRHYVFTGNKNNI